MNLSVNFPLIFFHIVGGMGDPWHFAVLVSNDSDLKEALKLVKLQNNKLVGLVFPNADIKRRPSRELAKYVDFVKHIRRTILQASQLPNLIPGTKIRKPECW